MESEIQIKTKLITYYVNGESQTTTHHKLTVRAILTNAGFTPAENYRLVRDAGNYTYTNLEEEVPLHENEKFTALFQGPTPTSQGDLA
jgi:phenylalanyl-tRNA synthetase beta subunit